MEYIERNLIFLKSDDGLDLEVFFDGSSPTEIHVDGDDFLITDDKLHRLYVLIRERYVSLYAVVFAASAKYEELKTEHDIIQAEEQAHQDEVSSPFLTGRI